MHVGCEVRVRNFSFKIFLALLNGNQTFMHGNASSRLVVKWGTIFSSPDSNVHDGLLLRCYAFVNNYIARNVPWDDGIYLEMLLIVLLSLFSFR